MFIDRHLLNTWVVDLSRVDYEIRCYPRRPQQLIATGVPAIRIQLTEGDLASS
jgi:hypothetical protein